MADYDGPPSGFSTMTPGTVTMDATFYRDFMEVPRWTTQPTWVQSGLGSGGSSEVVVYDINGYGYSHSG